MSPLDLRRDFGEDEVEHHIRHEEGQSQVEGLAADVQDEGLAALEVGGEFAEVGAQADGGKGEHEEPRADALFDAVDDALVDEGGAEVRAEVGAVDGEDDRSGEEADDELGETVPDFHQAGFASGGLFNAGAPVHGDTEGGHADEHVLDHLDGRGHVHGLGAEQRAGGGHGARGVDRTADPRAAKHFRQAEVLDEGGQGHHHDGGKGHGQAEGEGKLFLLGAARGGRGDGGGGAAHGHVGGDGDVQGRGSHLEDLLAEDEGRDEHDGGASKRANSSLFKVK